MQQLTSKAVTQSAIPTAATHTVIRHNDNNHSPQYVELSLPSNNVPTQRTTPEMEADQEMIRQARSMTCDARPAPRVQEQELPRVAQGATASSKKQAKKQGVKVYVAAGAITPASSTGSKK